MKINKLVFYGLSTLSLLVSLNSYGQKTTLPVEEFQKAIAKNNIQLLDVRTPEEYKSGHLSHALLADWNNQTEFIARTKALDKTKPIYAYCLSGVRSAAAAEWLGKNGYNAYSLSGGISAWKRADKPVEEAIAVKQITMEEYMAQIPKDKTVLVDIGAVWCPPCKKMTPLVDSISKKYSRQIIVVKVDGGEQTNICKTLRVVAFPTFIIYKNGKETWRKQGLTTSKEFIANF